MLELKIDHVVIPQILICFLLWFTPVAFAGSPAKPAGNALLLSDIHFDPLADPAIVGDLASHDTSDWKTILASTPSFKDGHYAEPGKDDTNYALLNCTLSAAAQQGPFDFVILSGDYLRHKFVSAFVSTGRPQSEFPAFATKTTVFVLRTIETTFRVPVFVALGNEDSACDDYGVAPSGDFLKALAGSLPILSDHPDAAADFRTGAFYELPHPTLPDEEIIVLNSVLWSQLFVNCQSDNTDPGAAEMKWLSNKLAEAKTAAKKIVLVMHIPPGIDGYRSAHRGIDKLPSSFWKEAYFSQFVNLMQDYGDIVQVALVGHTHMDDFRVLTTSNPARSVAFRTTPAVTPIFGNNPAFLVLHYNLTTGDIADTTTFYLDLVNHHQNQIWNLEYRFPTVYGYNGLTPANLEALATSIRTDLKTRQIFAGYYDVSAPSPLTTSSWPFYSFTETEFTPAAYSDSVKKQQTDPANNGK